MRLFESKIQKKITEAYKPQHPIVTFKVHQPKSRNSYTLDGELNPNDGRVKLHYDTFGDSLWTWQTPKESSLGWFIKMYGERIYLENYLQELYALKEK